MSQDQVTEDLETLDHDQMRSLFNIPKSAGNIESYYHNGTLTVSYDMLQSLEM